VISNIALVQTTRLGTSRPEIGLATGYLKSYLNEYRPGKYQIDLFESNSFLTEGVKRAGEYDVIGISTVSNQFNTAKQIAREIRAVAGRKPVVILGGVHISSLPHTLTDDFDWGAKGEGERTFMEFVDALDRGANEDELLAIPGIFRKKNGTVAYGPRRELIDDINTIPFPSRELFKKYRSVPSLITARGCPYRCDFCTNNLLWERKVRKPQPGRVAEEIQFLRRSLDDIKVVVFRDDIIFLNENYVRDVLERTKELYPDILSIPKVGYGHVNHLTPGMVKLLKEYGVTKVLCGFESASERILNILKYGSVKVANNQRAIDTCNEYGLEIGGNFIIGVPEETEEDVRATYEFLLKNLRAGKLVSASSSMLTPFPGERYWDIFTRQGVDLETFDWSRLDEPGFTTFYEDNAGDVTVKQWWAHRESMGHTYLGGIPKERFVDILQEYEPEKIELQVAYLKKDRKY